MVSTKINGLSNLNVIKKKSIKTRKGGTRHQSKTSFTGEGSVSKRVFRSTHSPVYKLKKSPCTTTTHTTSPPSTPSTRLSNFHLKMSRILTTTVDPTDRPHINDPLHCTEYIHDIFTHMLNTETLHLPTPGYMKVQDDVNERMRGILVDWLIEVHLKFKLWPETLFLTVNLIDRYLEVEEVKRDRLQLVGVTAMLIAWKYEEIYPPEVKDFVYITDNAYDKQEIMDMEYVMLKKFNFNVTVISPYRFLERFTKLWGDDDHTFFLAQYMIELALVEYRMLKCKPSLIASAALYLAHKINGRKDACPIKLQQYGKLTEKDIRPWAKEMCVLLQGANSTSLKAAKKKFSLAKFKEVALCQIFKEDTK